MFKNFLINQAWIFAAAILGFVIAAIFAGVFKLPRSIYLIPYVGLVSLFLYAYMRWSGLSIVTMFRHNWLWGIIGAFLLGIWTVHNILSQPASASSDGFNLAIDLFWSGVIYGVVDALLLSVLPVLATWQAFSTLGWTHSLIGKILVGFVACFASLFVTAAYHLGYPECRGSGIVGPLIGNGAMSIGYILTNNPIAAVFSHIAMHVTGVLHGPASVMQLPPHY